MAEVARRMPGKVSENQVYRWEMGKHQPKADTLEALANVLDTSVGILMAPLSDKDSTPDPFVSVDGARLERIENRLAELDDRMGEIVSLLSSDTEATARLSDAIVRAVEQALARQAREAGLPDRRRRQLPPAADQRPAA